jgi:hypothetical protein
MVVFIISRMYLFKGYLARNHIIYMLIFFEKHQHRISFSEATKPLTQLIFKNSKICDIWT